MSSKLRRPRLGTRAQAKVKKLANSSPSKQQSVVRSTQAGHGVQVFEYVANPSFSKQQLQRVGKVYDSIANNGKIARHLDRFLEIYSD